MEPGNGHIGRESSGELDGLLIGKPAWALRAVIKPQPTQVYRENLKKQIQEFNSFGITSQTDPVAAPKLEVFEELNRLGELALRTAWQRNLTKVDDVRKHREKYALGDGNDMLRFAGLGELSMDGGIETGYLRDPYLVVPGLQDKQNYRGELTSLSSDEGKTIEFYSAVIDAGYPIMMHVVGDGAMDVVVRDFAKLRDQKPFDHLRWVVTANCLSDPEQAIKLQQLGFLASVTPLPNLLGYQMLTWWGVERTKRATPVASFLNAGMVVGGGGDGYICTPNPLLSIEWMVTRRSMGDLQLDTKYGISVEEGLRMYTRSSAYTQFMENRVGILGSGMLADIAILSEDPRRVPADQIASIENDVTIVDGRVVFDRHKLFA